MALLTWQHLSTANAADEQSNASACSAAIASASDINAFALFEGVISCSEEGRQADTNLLMILGQVRATADMGILKPLDDENGKRPGELYLQLFYKFGGLGFDEFYRTQANVSDLEKRIRNADLSFKPNYNPGWAYGPSSKTDIYSQIASNAREQRIWQMRNAALKLKNDEYYEVKRALAELRKTNPILKVGTPAFKEHSKLAARLQKIAKGIPELPRPEDTTPYARLNEQDPEVAEHQVAIGFNGPAKGGILVLRSEAEVQKSWLANAVPDRERRALIAKTNFSTQVLVAVSFGERMNASGKIAISELSYHQGNSGYSVSTRIGVVPESCGVTFTESYPFVVGVTGAVPGAEIRSDSSSNFPDGCGPIASGKPAAQN
jgi:hypothetical protein